MCAASGQSCDTETCCSGLKCCTGGPVQALDGSVGGGLCRALCPVSDRNAKRDFVPVDPKQVLDALSKLPISTWTYKTEQPAARHIGPMAQDFMAAFHVGSNDKTIFQIDGDGVAFAAIQALNAEVKRLEKQNADMGVEIRALRSELRGAKRTSGPAPTEP